jgi:hypothetical protein
MSVSVCSCACRYVLTRRWMRNDPDVDVEHLPGTVSNLRCIKQPVCGGSLAFSTLSRRHNLSRLQPRPATLEIHYAVSCCITTLFNQTTIAVPSQATLCCLKLLMSLLCHCRTSAEQHNALVLPRPLPHGPNSNDEPPAFPDDSEHYDPEVAPKPSYKLHT